MITEIKSGNKIVALLVDNSDIQDGTHPITDSKWSLQLLMMRRKVGHVFAKHTHSAIDRSIPDLQEAIVVTEGKLLITVCEREGKDVGAYEVSAGQCLFLADGGYKIEVLKDAAFYEFKNGPHEDDKILL
ncbi:MAG: hypothetical protein U1D31_01115 [Patescibacteria group bacterium]|nr:hypothetical protein [bacterium]MDZ4240715.1 hypothetical protein [Patescibacteria group bacterium]